MSKEFEIPEKLINAIKQGNCVAFVGAGFSAPCKLPGWGLLLERIINKVKSKKDHDGRALIEEKLIEFMEEKIAEANTKGSAELYDLVAQLLEDHLSTQTLEKLVDQELKIPEKIPDEMKSRLELLSSIPFRAILTTNFDLLMKGPTPWTTASTQDDEKYPYASVLRPRNMTDDDMRFSLDAVIKNHMEQTDEQTQITEQQKQLQLITQKSKPIIKIHGSLGLDSDSNSNRSLVFTRDGYRKLVHSTPGYSNFLKTLLSTSTILYIGFSFSDGYLNELRGEVISMLYGESKGIRKLDEPLGHKDEPIGFAIINDKSKYEIEFFKIHEGVQIMPFSTYKLDSSGKEIRDFKGLDTYLGKIRDLTSFSYHIGKTTYGKKVLILDYKPPDEISASSSTKPTLSPTKPTSSPTKPTVRNQKVSTAEKATDQAAPPSTNWKMVGGDLVPLLTKSVDSYIAATPNTEKKESVYHFGTVEECLAALKNTENPEVQPFDAIITIFGESQEADGKHLWKTLVDGMRNLHPRAQTPFIVYSSNWNFSARRKYCLSYGAFDCVNRIEKLITALTKILEKPRPDSNAKENNSYDYY